VPWDIIRANPPWGAGGSIHNGLLSDPVRLYAPWRMLLADGLRHGHLPWWNPYVFAGNPFFANSQAALLYPPNLLYGLLPTDRATTVLILGHTLWAGLGAYLLARRSPLRLGLAPAMLAAIGFAFSGFASVWAEFPTFMGTLSWLPWLLLGLMRLRQEPTRKAIAGTALAVGMAGLAGHLQVFQYLLLAAATTVVVLAADAVWRRTGGAARYSLASGAAIGLGLLLAAPQLLATLQAGPLIARQQEPLQGLLNLAFRPAWLGLAALPRAYGDSRVTNWQLPGNENEFVAFVGLGCLLLAPLALARIRSAYVQALLAIEALSWAMATGSPVFELIYRLVPTINQVRAIARALSLHSFSLPLLAAIGLDVGLAWLAARPQLRRRLAWPSLGYLAAAALAVEAVLRLDQQIGGALSHDFMSSQLRGVVVGATALLVGAAMVVFRPVVGRVIALALPVVVFLELVVAYGAYNTTDPGPSPLTQPTPVADFLRSHPGRWVSFRTDEFTGNTAMAYGTPTVGGSDSFILSSFVSLYADIEKRPNDLLLNNSRPIKVAADLDSGALDALEVRWVLTREPPAELTPAKRLSPTPVFVSGLDRVYQRTSAGGGVGAYCLRHVASDVVLREALASHETTLAQEALTTEPVAGPAACSTSNHGVLRFGPTPLASVGDVAIDTEAVAASVDLPWPAAVVAAQSFYPGWTVTVDGRT
ncbi:MAG TPA: hypothetical protein VGR61_10740, partial [Candidatus Dormibacteraeota bacterium]|nr:hypothetical protein [Candidatus Dormibacteraeota bacterium]